MVGLVVLSLHAAGAWSWGQGLRAEDTRKRRAALGRAVVVHQGQLSVDVQAADLGEVLAQIGRQAGIRISVGPSAGKKVSTRFADVELEEGLRRLLRLASLNHVFLYAPGPDGTVAITEVRVLGEGTAESTRPATTEEPGSPSHKARRKARPDGTAAREVPELVPEVVEIAPERTPEPVQREPSEAMRRVLDAFTRGKQMGASPPDSQEVSPPAPQPPSDAPEDVKGGFSR
jgi:hypothetical protein